MELINLAGIALLALLIRKLVWCLRWLWCYYHGKETPEPVSFLPRRPGASLSLSRGQEQIHCSRISEKSNG